MEFASHLLFKATTEQGTISQNFMLVSHQHMSVSWLIKTKERRRKSWGKGQICEKKVQFRALQTAEEKDDFKIAE